MYENIRRQYNGKLVKNTTALTLKWTHFTFTIRICVRFLRVNSAQIEIQIKFEMSKQSARNFYIKNSMLISKSNSLTKL